MDFKAPGASIQSMELLPKARGQLSKSSVIMIKAHSGGLGCPIIDSYSLGPK
jgi:hypothetical protein